MHLQADNGKYISAEQGGGLVGGGEPPALVADRDAAHEWETFTRVAGDRPGTIALRCWKGTYVSAEGGGGGVVSTNRTSVGPWESFLVVKTPKGRALLVCPDGAHCLRVRTDLPRPIIDATGSAEGMTFQFDNVRVDPQRRSPLTRFPVCRSCPAPDQYFKTLPWTPPATRDFMRMDAWGVEIAGLPQVPGGSSEHPERCLTWFFDRWPADWQQRILEAHAMRGYTHFLLSWPDSHGPLDNGPQSPPGAAQSLDQFVATCRRVKDAGFYPVVALASKYFDPANQMPDQWAARVDPVIDALIAAQAVDEFTVWEWNSFNTPGEPTIKALKHMGRRAHAAGCSFWLHFLPHYTSWFADGEPRGRYGFYDDLGADIDGINYQAVTSWDVGELQARIVDTLVQFAKQRWGHKLRAFELTAMDQYTCDHPNEDEANMIGYLACCTIDNVSRSEQRVWGFGNGARMPDGSVI